MIIGEKDILILGKGPTQGLEHTLSAEKMYLINFTENNKKLCFSLFYNGANSYLLMVQKSINLKQNSEIVAALYVLETFQKTG